VRRSDVFGISFAPNSTTDLKSCFRPPRAVTETELPIRISGRSDILFNE